MIKFCTPLAQRTDPALYQDKNLTGENPTRPRVSPLRRFFHWVNPLTAWRQIRHVEGARIRFSAGFAIGIFIANLPTYGVQTLLGLYVARRFKLHPAAVIAGVNIAVPPFNAIMIACGIAVGHFILHGSWPHLQEFHLSHGQLHAVLLPALWEWVIGSLVFGLVMAAVSFVLIDLLLGIVSDPKPADEGN